MSFSILFKKHPTKKLFYILSIIFNFIFIQISYSQVVINEIFLSGFNGSEVTDHGFKVDDWIELYNSSNNSLNLTGWYLSDNQNEPTKWRIPGGTISANDHLVFNANGLDDSNINTNFKIDQSELNEEVVLSDPSGSIVDVYKIRTYTQIGGCIC